MMDLRTIRHLADEAGKKAARRKREPFVPYDRDSVAETTRAIPNLGSYVPPGWKEVERLFVDKTGFGDESEPAMTFKRFVAWVQDHIDKEYGYALVEEGQFQVYIGVFERTEPVKKLTRRRRRLPPQEPEFHGPAEKDLPPAKPGEVTLGTLTPEGVVDVQRVKQVDIVKCPFHIFDAGHYRADGTCRCNDPEEQKRLIRFHGYKRRDFTSRGL